MRAAAERALSASALLAAVLAAVWAYPQTSEGGLFVLAAAVSAIPLFLPRRRVFGSVCLVLLLLAAVGLFVGGLLLLPTAVAFALLAVRGRIAKVVAGGVVLVSVVGLSSAVYREHFQVFDAYEVTVNARADPEVFQGISLDPVVTGVSWSDSVIEVGFRSDISDADARLLRERLEHLPGVIAVQRCAGTLAC